MHLNRIGKSRGWKGALYGIDYESWRSSTHLYRSSRTLLELCCQVIVRDATFTKGAVAVLPYELHYSLMRSAIERARHPAVKVLLEAWPSRILSVSVLAPHYHRSGQVLYDRLLYSVQLEDAVRLTSLLIHSFVQLVQKPLCDQQLKCLKMLDLTGFPVVEPVLQLVSHTIAERHFHCDCPAEKEQCDPVETRSGKRLRVTPRECSCEPYVIRMDCYIRDDQILDELHRALATCRMAPYHLKLEVVKIDAVCLGEKSVARLLKSLEPDVVTGMGLEYNAFCNEGLSHLCPQICKFVNLTALDLSCNNLKFCDSAPACSAMGAILKSLTKLGRLDLSNNKLSSCLSVLLSSIPKSRDRTLEYLKLSACQLKDDDVDYLALCPYVSGLRELDLSENFFASRVQGLVRLLQNVRNNLQVLEFEDCGFTGVELPNLLGSISRLWGLRYLNIARNRLTTDDLCQGLPSLRCLPHLECVRLSITCNWLNQTIDSHFKNERGKRLRVERVIQEGTSDGTKTVGRVPVLVVWDDQWDN